MVDLARRNLVFSLPLIFGLPIPLNGCFLAGIFRLGLSRGAAATLGRLARSGGSGAALSFGRGISAASRLTSISTRSFPRTHIIDPRGRLVAEAIPDGPAVSFQMDGATIFQSVETSFGFRHYDMNGPVGKTYRQSKGVNRHVSQDEELICIDQVDRSRHLIVHKDATGRLIGSSRISVQPTNLDLYVDRGTIDSIDSYVKELGLNCPDAKKAYREMQNSKERCGTGNQNSCSDASVRSAIYRDARNACRGYE